MSQEKITYFFREKEKFINFIQKYDELKSLKIKNEDFSKAYIFGNEKFEDQNSKSLLYESEILILTSENAFYALKKLASKELILNKKFIFVGKNLESKFTSEFCNQQILFCGNSVLDVKNFLDLNLKDKKILYLRGEIIKSDLKLFFSNISELIVYKIKYKNEFSFEFLQDLELGLIHNLIFFSGETFRNFFLIAKKKNLLPLFEKINLFWLGNFEKITKIEHHFKKIFISTDFSSKNLIYLLIKK